VQGTLDESSQTSTKSLAQLSVEVDDSEVRAPKKGAPLALLGFLAVALVSIGGGAAWLVKREPTPPEPAAVPALQPVPEAAPAPAPVADPGPEPEPVHVPERVPARPEPTPTPKPKAVAATATGEDGYLTLRTEPWCDVYLGAEKLGTTPLIRAPVASGRRTLLLKNEKAGFTKKLTLTIEPGKELKQALVVPQGSIAIDAPPGTEVWLDGARMGTAPLPPFDAVEGKHEVRLGAMSKSVKLKAGQTEKVSP